MTNPMITRIAEAIGASDNAFAYSFNLTKLIDGEETHTLIMHGYDPVDFDNRDAGYALITERRNSARAAAILAAIGSAELLRDALTEIRRLRLATSEGSLRVRSDRIWEIADAALATTPPTTNDAIPAGEIERLRKVMADATPGPWRMDHGAINAHIHQVDGLHWLASCVIGHDDWHSPAQSRGVKDATLIVEAVNALPKLLAALSAAPSAPTTEAGEEA